MNDCKIRTHHNEVMLKGNSLQLTLIEIGDDRLSENDSSSERLGHCNDFVCPIVEVVVLPWPVLDILGVTAKYHKKETISSFFSQILETHPCHIRKNLRT